MKLSFGMIFSIILIIIFIASAFYGIQKFLEVQDSVKTAQFMNGLQADVDKMWQSSGGSTEKDYLLPLKIDAVCFEDDDYENFRFRSEKFVGGGLIKHIDIAKITEDGDLCIDNIDGKVKMIIEKNYGDALVMIKKE